MGELVNKNGPKCLVALQDQLRSFFTGPKPFWEFFTGLGPIRTTVSVEPCIVYGQYAAFHFSKYMCMVVV